MIPFLKFGNSSLLQFNKYVLFTGLIGYLSIYLLCLIFNKHPLLVFLIPLGTIYWLLLTITYYLYWILLDILHFKKIAIHEMPNIKHFNLVKKCIIFINFVFTTLLSCSILFPELGIIIDQWGNFFTLTHH